MNIYHQFKRQKQIITIILHNKTIKLNNKLKN